MLRLSVVSGKRSGLDPTVVFPGVKPSIRKTVAVDECGILCPMDHFQVGLVNLSECCGVTTMIGMMLLCLRPKGIFYNQLQSWRSQLRPAQLQMDQ
jgi:hypothetical protein